MIKLNCDLGESFGSWTMGLDEQAMPHIDQANIACGFHAGDPLVMMKTLALAKQHNVMVGAHPSYPDLVGFGRRSMNCSAEEIHALLTYQISAIEGMAKQQGLTLNYVKPHGALYNDMMKNSDIRHQVMKAVADHPSDLVLMLQATPDLASHKLQAAELGLTLWGEAFADRCYDDDGALLARSKQGAVLTPEQMLKQVAQLVSSSTVTTISGNTLTLDVDSLCVHGDNEAGVKAIKEIRGLLNNAN